MNYQMKTNIADLTENCMKNNTRIIKKDVCAASSLLYYMILSYK